MTQPGALPPVFCWTRFGWEGGESADEIIERKEIERHGNGGIFLWGIGNSVGSSIQILVTLCSEPEVLFSPIKGPPREIDVRPKSVVAWTGGVTLDGGPYNLPPHSLVRGQGENGRARYALVCFSEDPLTFANTESTVRFDEIRNLVSGRPVGASQVTAVVRVDSSSSCSGRDYVVACRAKLVPPFFVRLTAPVPVDLRHDQEDSRQAAPLIRAPTLLF
jgi:hypothetical protein